ncbi:hypothetical protein Ancab_035505 [Ancistrocladus abbreviatus]
MEILGMPEGQLPMKHMELQLGSTRLVRSVFHEMELLLRDFLWNRANQRARDGKCRRFNLSLVILDVVASEGGVQGDYSHSTVCMEVRVSYAIGMQRWVAAYGMEALASPPPLDDSLVIVLGYIKAADEVVYVGMYDVEIHEMCAEL